MYDKRNSPDTLVQREIEKPIPGDNEVLVKIYSVSVPEIALAMKPVSVSFETAAALPMAAITALQALRDKGKTQPGQKVLICGAGGGVGMFAVQLAKYFGVEVTAVCGEKSVKVIKPLGAGLCNKL